MFQRQVKMGDGWVPEHALEWRNVDLCDGCGEIIPDEAEFSFRVSVFNDSRLADPRGLTVHKARVCAEKAILKRAAALLDDQGWLV